MNKKITATLFVLAVTIMIGISNIGPLSAGELQPGSSEDPVVTKGYVDKLIRDIQLNGTAGGSTSDITNERVKAQEEMIGLLNNELNRLKSDVGKMGNAESSRYEVVDVSPGQRLIGKQGSEIILRSGEGTAIISDNGGLQDMTEGIDITSGFVPKYHLMIIPREDGRGVLVTKQATFMVRGGYTVE
ncbi:MAG TPA: hypothetical protein GX707_06655 [Epulopiscium sp.]|nr:hypothetical protein [Candidatus Epulonipiscium sp.]